MARISELLVKDNNLNLIKTNKYKDITIYIKCAFKYTKKLKACLSVLSLMMQEQCEKYPTKNEMSNKKDMLYGIAFDCLCQSIGDLSTISLNYNFTNPKYFDEVNENDYIDFIDETLRRPLFNEKLLEESKRIVVDSIKRKLDKPNYFAMNGFYNEVSKDDIRFDVYVNLEPNDIYQLSLDDIVDTYNKLFKSRVDIYVIGDYTNNLINYLKRYSSNEDLYCLVEPLKLPLRNEIKITKEVGQSTLIVSYKTPYVRTSKDYYAFNLGNILFGGIPTSLLFSEVREKDNLCYLIYSRGLRYEGLVYVETLIDYNNKTKALEEIRNQFNKVIKKEYDPNLLEIAKKMLISNSLTIDDDMDYLVSYHYEGNLSNSYISINDYIKEVEKITVDDVARVFSNYEEYLVYYLEGTKDE